jgi:hypothetical protein
MVMKCSLCGEEIGDNLIGGMCQDCLNGFNSSSNVVRSDKMKEEEVTLRKKNCRICSKLTGQDNEICIECLQEYHPKIKEYLNKFPNMSYLEAVGNKNIPVPRKVFYEFCEAGIIKIK